MLVSCLPGASLASEPGVDPLEFGLAVKLGPIAANFTGQGKLDLWRATTRANARLAAAPIAVRVRA